MPIDNKSMALGGLILLLGLAAGYTLSHSPKNDFVNPDLALSIDPDCTLNEASCVTTLTDDSALEFKIEPRPIQGISPLVFSISAPNLEIKQAVIDLSGIDMNMGSYRFEFKPKGDNLYAANGNLPVCVRGQMLWQADIWLETKQKGLVKVPYIFSVVKP